MRDCERQSATLRHFLHTIQSSRHTCIVASTFDSHSMFRMITRRKPALHQLSVRSYTSSGNRPAAPTTRRTSSPSPCTSACAAAVFSGFSFQFRSTSALRKFTVRGATESGVDEREDGAVSMELDQCELSDIPRSCVILLGISKNWERVEFWGLRAVGEGSLGSLVMIGRY